MTSKEEQEQTVSEVGDLGSQVDEVINCDKSMKIIDDLSQISFNRDWGWGKA